MSGKLVMDVWHANYGDASTILLLMALADEANDAGECTVDIQKVASKARQSERNCRYLLRRLEALEIVERFEARGRGHKNRYQLRLENLQNLQNLQPLQQLQVLENLQKVQPLQVIKPAKPATIAELAPPSSPPLPQTPSPSLSSPVPENPKTLPPYIPPKGKGAKKPSNIQTEALAVLTHLNSTNSRRYENLSQIQILLNSGVPVEDCLLVIDFGHAVLRYERTEWYAQYFDNETPFRPKNFDKYRARARVWDEQGRPPPGATKTDNRLELWAEQEEAKIHDAQ